MHIFGLFHLLIYFYFYLFPTQFSKTCEENRKAKVARKVARWCRKILKNNHSGTETRYFEDSEELG